MPRTIQNVMRTRGPFFGLEEKRDETSLGPEYATALNNVLLHRGRIEPRPGFKEIIRLNPQVDVGGTDEDSFIAQMQVVNSAPEVGSAGQLPEAYIVVVTRRGIFLVYTKRSDLTVAIVEEASNVLPALGKWGRGTIVPFRDQLYFLFERAGNNYASRLPTYSSQLAFRRIGLTSPAAADWEAIFIGAGQTAFPAGSYEFKVTWYDKANDVESNATLAEQDPVHDPAEPNQVPSDHTVHLHIRGKATSSDAVAPASHIRVYAKVISLESDTNAGAEVAHRLIAEIPVTDMTQSFEDRDEGSDDTTYSWWEIEMERQHLGIGSPSGADPALSVVGSGPFSPTRNGVPIQANTAVVFSDSMVYASVESDSYGSIFFSEVGHPEHVSPIDVITFEDSGREKTTAFFVYQGRLIVFKQNSIYIIAGVLNRKSNTNVALGQSAPSPQYSKFRTESNVGCYNLLGGNGVIECDSRLYFNSQHGIYIFDGMTSRKISDAVDDTIQATPDFYRQQCTMANDDRNGLLWICYAPEDASGNATVLCYDYRRGNPDMGVGTWTVHTVSAGIGCVATARTGDEGINTFDGKAMILAGVMSGFADEDNAYAVAELLEGERNDLGANVHWAFTVAPQDLRLPDRMKRWHYLTVDHERQEGRIAATSTVETSSGLMTRTSSFDASLSHTSLQRISLRGTRITVKLDGIQSEVASQIINGFSIDAEPIGRR